MLETTPAESADKKANASELEDAGTDSNRGVADKIFVSDNTSEHDRDSAGERRTVHNLLGEAEVQVKAGLRKPMSSTSVTPQTTMQLMNISYVEYQFSMQLLTQSEAR